MSNASAALAASSPFTVLERKMLWVGGVIEITVPETANEGSYPSDAGPQRFVRFAQSVKGGVVNFFVHDAEPTRLLGKKIIADVKIWEKRLADGRKFLYVDFHPTANTSSAVHRMSVMNAQKKDIVMEEGFAAFETPAPFVGVVVVAPVGSKILIKAPLAFAGTQKPKFLTIPSPVSTGDRKLDQLIKDGWKINHENDKCVYLWKMKGGKEKHLVHYKPQLAKKQKPR